MEFLKLGGSLLTDKDNPRTARHKTLERLAKEIKSALTTQPGRQLVIGHGSGSFGHIPARQYNTRAGVHTHEEWLGFAEVWYQARELNQIVIDAFHREGIPCIAFPPSAIMTSKSRKQNNLQIKALRSALDAGIVPVVAGDVIFDQSIGGTIFSTEDVFMALDPYLKPEIIYLCGKDEGVWEDYPICTRLIRKITPHSYPLIQSRLEGSQSTDVTGGMREKVELMLKFINRNEKASAIIFSGERPENLYEAMTGIIHGTIIARE